MIKLTNFLLHKDNRKPHRCKLVLRDYWPEARTHSYIWVCTVCGDRYICAKQEFKLSMLEGYAL